jgi:hypothetical protein
MAFGANTTCIPLRQGSQDTWHIAIGPGPWSEDALANLSVSVSNPQIGAVNCSAMGRVITDGAGSGACPKGPLAAEIVTAMEAVSGSSSNTQEVCPQLIVSAWIRSPLPGHCFLEGSASMNLTDENATVLACMPKISASSAQVTINAQGGLQLLANLKESTFATDRYFSGKPEQLILQANNFLVGRTGAGVGFGSGGVWHNDSFPSDWNNYVMEQIAGVSDFLDPGMSPPPPGIMAPLFQQMYQKLFAIWLGMNQAKFLNASKDTEPAIKGAKLEQETRISVSRSMFIVGEVILGVYVLVRALYYGKRPGHHLPRPPTMLASTICLFAANQAVKDARKVVPEARRYGYGEYVGTDGRMHTGIERTPLVQVADGAHVWSWPLRLLKTGRSS